ncbi:peptidase [Streptomyces microflavus]
MSPTSCARLRDARALAALGLAAGIAVPAALLGGPQAAAHSASLVAETAAEAAETAEAADEQPACGDPGAKEFPIETRIQEAPKTYVSGGGYGTWFLDLTNTTDTSCRALHPVLVLNDEDRKLTADQIQLKFSEPGRPGTEHRVTWETTDRHEQIGVFDGGDPGPGSGSDSGSGSGDSDDGFLGFTVPAGSTVSVRVRMAFTSDTGPGRVTAHAAVVQRRHQDRAKGAAVRTATGWGVGEYRFVIADGATGEIPGRSAPRRTSAAVRTSPPSPGPVRTRPPAHRHPPTPAPTHTDPGKERAPEPSSPPRPDGSATPREDGGGKERPARPPHYATGRPLPNSPAPDRSCCPGPEPSPGSSSSAAGSS